MFTDSGAWEIINTTRYNTEDIVGVFNRYEELLLRSGVAVSANRNREHGQVKLGDYSPKFLSYERNVWTPNGFQRETVPCYVRGPMTTTRHLRDVGLVRPSKLYENPVEALSAPRVEGSEVVPVKFVMQFVTDAVSMCYDPVIPSTVITERFDFEAAHIRVNRNRANKKHSGRSRAAILSGLHTDHRHLSWTVHVLHQAVRSCQEKNLASIQTRFNDLGLERRANQEAFAQLMQALERFTDVVEADDVTLRQEME